jgi:hypothetical protein
MSSLTETVQNPITRYCIGGSMSRYAVDFARVYYLPTYLLLKYPENVNEIAIMFSVTTVAAGITSSILGGLIADKFGS